MQLERVKKLLNEAKIKCNKSEDINASGTSQSTSATNVKIAERESQIKTANAIAGGGSTTHSDCSGNTYRCKYFYCHCHNYYHPQDHTAGMGPAWTNHRHCHVSCRADVVYQIGIPIGPLSTEPIDPGSLKFSSYCSDE